MSCSPSHPDSSQVGSRPRSQSVWDALRRPLGVDDRCRPSHARRISRQFGEAIGTGPVYAVLTSTDDSHFVRYGLARRIHGWYFCQGSLAERTLLPRSGTSSERTQTKCWRNGVHVGLRPAKPRAQSPGQTLFTPSTVATMDNVHGDPLAWVLFVSDRRAGLQLFGLVPSSPVIQFI
jgi:hypothetical protein